MSNDNAIQAAARAYMEATGETAFDFGMRHAIEAAAPLLRAEVEREVVELKKFIHRSVNRYDLPDDEVAQFDAIIASMRSHRKDVSNDDTL